MRIWSVHPRYLDRQGLLACWRESLLAQAVLADATKGYQHHPQLERFREQPDPLVAIGAYLAGLHASGSATPDTGWAPAFATLWRGKVLKAACPLYVKDHSYGEYVFDWAWANAY